ncbi:MAG: UDP-glucose 4-epimerase GalE [Bryobacterales bacterium]|nr:UDP-glucose 4-epimerase GalE [Bryobacterales bacterium]
MQILVTGGAGYIGSHTAKALSQAGYEPVVFDSLEYGHRSAVQWGPLEEGDLGDPEALRRVLKKYSFAAAIHFAAYISVGESVREPGKYFRNNFGNTLNLLDGLREAGMRRIVFSSTAAVYGDPLEVPIPETHRLQPVSPYGDSKLMMARAIGWYGQAYGLRSVVLRYFNAAGADPDGQLGENHEPETHLIPLAIRAAMGKAPELHLFGTDYPSVDGTAVRDYVHVSDLAAAHVLAVRYLEQGGESTICNLGTGTGITVRQVIDAVEQVSGRKVPVKLSPRREGDAPELVAEASRARTLLGWTPVRSDLRSIVESAYHWHVSSGE